MIEVQLTGTVEVQSTDAQRGSDGADDYSLSTTLRQTVEVDATKEFHEGYVNLEGYAYSAHHVHTDDLLHSFRVPDHAALGDWVVRRGNTADLSVTMEGTKDDWIQQAARYVTERPNLSIDGALSRFASWDETSDATLRRARKKARKVENTDEKVGGLSDREYGTMMAQLHNRCGRRDISQFAPEGYAAPE